MSETIGPTPRRDAVAVIGAWFDRPSVYMGGPSDRSIRKAVPFHAWSGDGA